MSAAHIQNCAARTDCSENGSHLEILACCNSDRCAVLYLFLLYFLLLVFKRDCSSQMKIMKIKNQTLSYSLSNFLHSLSQLEKNLFCQTTSFLLVGGRFETKQRELKWSKKKIKEVSAYKQHHRNSQFYQYFRVGKKTRSGGKRRNSVETLHKLNSELLWRYLVKNTAQIPVPLLPQVLPPPAQAQPPLPLESLLPFPPMQFCPAGNPAPSAPGPGWFIVGVKLQWSQSRAAPSELLTVEASSPKPQSRWFSGESPGLAPVCRQCQLWALPSAEHWVLALAACCT